MICSCRLFVVFVAFLEYFPVEVENIVSFPAGLWLLDGEGEGWKVKA